MNEEFVNSFIETMHNKISELTRSEIMLQTRLGIAERTIKAFGEENQNLKNEIERLTTSLNKKAAKTKEDF